MHILSCLDEHYKVGSPVGTLDLSTLDRATLLRESKRLIGILQNPDRIWVTTSDTGKEMVSTSQVVCNKAVQITPFTALLLTRLNSCAESYLRGINSDVAVEVEEDLSTDAVILRLEGNPQSVYVYVYKVMTTPSLSYDAKMEKLVSVLNTIKTHSVVETTPVNHEEISRFELQSTVRYWKSMLLGDYIEYFGTTPPEFNIKTISEELEQLGFYGFVNPLEMNNQFAGSRVHRKIDVNIADWVVDFLTTAIKSGGVTL